VDIETQMYPLWGLERPILLNIAAGATPARLLLDFSLDPYFGGSTYLHDISLLEQPCNEEGNV